jgi:YVTN family beta-propeller protein
MPRPYLPWYHRSLFATILILSVIIFCLVGSQLTRNALAQSEVAAPFRNFEATQIHPLALTPDGTRLLAVNSPNASLSVFQLVSGLPVLTAEIPVGLEPVSVTARNNREAWVVNWLSDSVSIVDLITGNVTRTIDVGDEPTDVLFAAPGNARAFVCVSGGASFSEFSIDISQHGRGQVKIFDAADPNLPLQTLTLFGKQPRSLAGRFRFSRVRISLRVG